MEPTDLEVRKRRSRNGDQEVARRTGGCDAKRRGN